MAQADSKTAAQGLRQALGELLSSQHLAVLATHMDGQPYCSLVGFAGSSDFRSLIFATARSTRKFENLTSDPRVAVMIDSRSNRDSDFHEAVAVTAVGQVREVPKTARSRHLRRYLAKHPHLKEFVASQSCALLVVKVRKYVIVRKFQEVSELKP